MLHGQHLSFDNVYRLPQSGASPHSLKQDYEYWRSPVAAQADENVVTNHIFSEQPIGNSEEIQWSLINLYKDLSVEIKKEAEAILCLRCKSSPSIRSCQVVDVFQSVYKRDKLKAQQQGNCSVTRKYPEPTVKQLREMRSELEKKDIYISSSTELLKELQKIAQNLQKMDLLMSQDSSETENPEQHNSEISRTTIPQDIPVAPANNPEIIEYESILNFLREKQNYALEYGVQQGIEDKLNHLQKSCHKIHASQFIPSLKLMYCDGASQDFICEKLNFPNQSLVKSILAPKELAHQIRFRTIEKLLDLILVKAEELGLTSLAPMPNYLSNLMKNIELLVDQEIFEIAIQELQTQKKNCVLNSLYAQKLRQYLNQV